LAYPYVPLPRRYDHCYVASWAAPSGGSGLISTTPGDGAPAEIAVLRHSASGRTMRVLTTQPGVQLYTGNWLPGPPDAPPTGEHGPHTRYRALCLETQNFPDAINKRAAPGGGAGGGGGAAFPDSLLRKGQEFRHVTVHAFEW